MKIAFISTISFLLYLNFVSSIYPQYLIQNVSDENTLKDLHIFNKDSLIAVGDKDGKLLKSYDGGKSWIVQYLGTKNSIMSINFIDDIGWAVGEYNTIYKSINRGKDWTKIESSFTNGYLYSVFFIDKSIGWLLDQSYVYMSSDGGLTWNKQTCNTSGNNLNKIFFINDSTGWIVGGSLLQNKGGIYKTTNCGYSWNDVHSGDATICDIFFINENIGWAVGDKSSILKSYNGGINWEKQDCNIFGIFQSVFFLDSLKGFIVGSQATILETTDGGRTWNTKSYLSTTEQYNSIKFCDNNNGFIVGTNNCILKTTNSGKEWDFQTITSDITEPNSIIAHEFILQQNYPNPLNPTTTIEYEIPKQSAVKIEVYDLLGRLVKILVNNEQTAGIHKIKFDGSMLSSGIYFYKITSGNFSQTKKMVLLK